MNRKKNNFNIYEEPKKTQIPKCNRVREFICDIPPNFRSKIINNAEYKTYQQSR